MEDLKLYLTSLEPDLNQTAYSQSIGGHISNSLVYPETTLNSTVGLFDLNLDLNIPESGSFSEWQGIEYINIGAEMIQVPPISNGTIVATQRGYNNIYNMHIAGDVVRASSAKELLNDVFNDSRKQYRCIAIKNVSRQNPSPSYEQIAYDLGVYLKQDSRSKNSIIKIALELPSSQYLSGTSTEWNEMKLTDSSIRNAFEDNHFNNAYLKITSGEASGQGKVIGSYEAASGTFTFLSSFSTVFDFDKNVTYEVLPSPAQRVKTGTISPAITAGSVTNFLQPDINTPLRFFQSPNASDPLDLGISDLNPNDVMYLWIEREVLKGSPEFFNNDFVVNVKYKVSE